MSRAARPIIGLIVLFTLVASHALAADEGIEWLRGWPEAEAAARQSSKFILVYIYQRNQAACVEMDKSTLVDDGVIQKVNHFVPLALNGSAAANKEFCNKYGVGVRTNDDKGMKMDFSAIPAYLFLDANGKEYFRTFGFYPATVFGEMLDRATRLINGLCALTQRPNDARLNNDIGQVYLELELLDQGKPYLRNAVKLDPENTTGARADAELNLIIIGIPENPDLAFRQLVAYQVNYPETKRGLELRYYMAVAELANEHVDGAKQILLDFQSIPSNAVNGKPTNPDYTNPWTVMADLLYQRLMHPKGTKPAPK